MKYLFDRRFLIAVWITIFLMKFAIGLAHLLTLRKSINPVTLDLSQEAYQGTNPKTLDALNEFALTVNNTFDTYQRSAQREHLFAAGGYLTAALTSFLSIMLVLRDVLFIRGANTPLSTTIEI